MFKLFGKRNKPSGRPTQAPVRPAGRPQRAGSNLPLHEPLPVPQVHEDHDESAWDLWEHSQMQLDSQLGPLTASETVRVNSPRPSQFSELDPFSSVRRKNDR